MSKSVRSVCPAACLVALSLVAAPARADMTFTQGALYGQVYTASNGQADGRRTGFTLGGFGSLDWTFNENKTSTAWFLITEVQVGLGSMPGTLLGVDLVGDLLGIAGRYKINEDVQLGIFYEPVEIYATPIGGFIGAKLALKAAYRNIQVEVARGGVGAFYGWLLPGDSLPLHLVSVQYRAKDDVIFGGRLTSASTSAGTSGVGVMGFYGVGF